MAAQLRELRSKIRATKSIGKITKAMELIATSRISKAQARVDASRPYAEEITKVLSALASAATTLDDPLLTERENPKRVGVLVVTSDKGLCGAYNANVLRAAEELQSLLREQGKTPVVYVMGAKGVSYYRFRDRKVAESWTGFTQVPRYENAQEAGKTLVAAFNAGAGIYAANGAESIAEGVAVAEQAIDAGKALEAMERLVVLTQDLASRAAQETVRA